MNNKLLDSISPDTQLVIWPSKSALSKSSTHFQEFDYLYDGLISEMLDGQNRSEKELQDILTFRTKHFQKELWLVFIGPEAHSSHIDEQFNIMSQNLSNELVLIAGDKTKWDEELPRRYTKFKFKSI